ncbi:MAG: Mfa1 family fimbria major subunit [Clostridium sp.]|nr:Mfa1 family fimbria major subunit [Clostridium sp.]
MMHLKKLMVGCLALSLFSCSSDEDIIGQDNQGTEVNLTGDVYAKLTLSLPMATRSTGNVGDEYGQDYENKVGSVLVVLAAKNANTDAYTFITCSEADGTFSSGKPGNPTYTLVFENEALKEQAGNDIYVFAYANPTAALRNFFTATETPTTFTDEVADLMKFDNMENPETDEIWQPNRFLMTSVSVVKASGLTKEAVESTDHNTPETAINLGTVPVERVVARFDYKQVNNNKYDIKSNVVDEDGNMTEEVVGNVELTHMALFNMASSYYYLPRTSTTGLLTNINLCPGKAGMEQNWVVSPRANDKLAYGPENHGLDDYFRFSLANNSSRKWTEITSLNNNNEDDDEGWIAENKEGYRIWRYATENTIPRKDENDYQSQVKGITTGVVFKGKINIVENSSLADAVNDNEPIYMYNDVLYGGVSALAAAAEAYPVSSLADAFKRAFVKVTTGEGESTTVSYQENTGDNSPVACKFTVYRYDESEGCYPVYYYYYNRHNDNEDNADMGMMEFGVVRNNVYKLSVTGINRFGHPGKPGDDPDPEDPDDPDEENKVYFKVAVEVLPWVVRVNNIEF